VGSGQRSWILQLHMSRHFKLEDVAGIYFVCTISQQEVHTWKKKCVCVCVRLSGRQICKYNLDGQVGDDGAGELVTGGVAAHVSGAHLLKTRAQFGTMCTAVATRVCVCVCIHTHTHSVLESL